MKKEPRTTNQEQRNNNEVFISVKNVSKKFCKNLRQSMAYGIIDLSKNLVGIKSDSSNLRKDEFWAINDISFDLKRGDVLGLIGLNGSGKSTLLRLLTGIFPPDKGEIKIKGRVGALIAVGAGFHPYMTARENIYLNGTVLGMTRDEIDSKFRDIVDFADIGDFLDTPVSAFSSGMRVRLGFSIAAFIDPDVTLIDEVLAVGDFHFRQKCSEKINELRQRSTVILVSHNMRNILMLCSKTIVMDRGQVAFMGDTKDAISSYLDISKTNQSGMPKKSLALEEEIPYPIIKSGIYGETFHNKDKVTDVQYRWSDNSGNNQHSFKHGGKFSIEFSFKLLVKPDNLIIGIPIWSNDGYMITGITTDMASLDIVYSKDGIVQGKLNIDPIIFNPGKYSFSLNIKKANEFYFRKPGNQFVIESIPMSYGCVTPLHNWEFY